MPFTKVPNYGPKKPGLGKAPTKSTGGAVLRKASSTMNKSGGFKTPKFAPGTKGSKLK
jgi:hypothetical protein